MYQFLYQLAAKVDPNKVGIPVVNTDTGTLQIIVNTVFSIAGTLCVLFIIIGGLRYTLSTGDPNNLSKAKNTIIYASVGLVAVLLAFGIVQVVIKVIQG